MVEQRTVNPWVLGSSPRGAAFKGKVMEKNNIVGFTCGAFDILHTGHALMLKECKEVCDHLIIGLQRDPSIDRRDKNKPIQSVEEIIEYGTEEELYQILNNMWETGRVDIRIIGEDWKGKDFTGNDLSMKVHFNSRKHNWSSSNLRDRIYKAELKGRQE